MSGFIPHKLLRKYRLADSSKSRAFCFQLKQLWDNFSSTDDSFRMDSEAWLRRINHGSLFVISDDAFTFFIAIEKRLCDTLPTMLVKQNVSVDHVKVEILQEKAVMALWTDVTRDADESMRDELLREIVSLFVTIRGFSVVASWLEQYKREKSLIVSRSRGIRKSLNKSGKQCSWCSLIVNVIIII